MSKGPIKGGFYGHLLLKKNRKYLCQEGQTYLGCEQAASYHLKFYLHSQMLGEVSSV